MNKNTKKIRDLAAYVCDRLDGKVLIHRYDAYSTNSVYLKFDYGVANSLRIADHAGKKHLAYRFNRPSAGPGGPGRVCMDREGNRDTAGRE